MIGYDDIDITTLSSIQAQNLTLSITRDRYSARICNSINGQYRVVDGVIQTSYTMSTKMACPDNLISKME
jgi:heat shock protein HslJ